MNHRPGPVGISALSSTPSTMHCWPIFWMLPSAFSSIVVRPPAMLPLVGCESERSDVLWRLIDFLIAIEHAHELGANLVVAAARGDDLLAAGELGRFAEHQRAARRVELVERVADGGVGAAAGRRVRLAALGRYPQLSRARTRRAAARSPHCRYLARHLRRAHDRVVIAVQLDAEAGDRLAGRRDAVDDALGPALLDADDDDRRDIRIAAGADQRAEVQVEVGAELQPAVGMRDRQRALDIVRDGLARGVGQVVDRQDDDVVAHADAAVLAPVAHECLLHVRHPSHQRLVLMLWTCACCAGLDRRDHLADVDAVLDDGVADVHVLRAPPCGRAGCPARRAS